MHVTARPLEAPIALIERPFTADGERQCLRILVFREGLLHASIIALLNRLLGHI